MGPASDPALLVAVECDAACFVHLFYFSPFIYKVRKGYMPHRGYWEEPDGACVDTAAKKREGIRLFMATHYFTMGALRNALTR